MQLCCFVIQRITVYLCIFIFKCAQASSNVYERIKRTDLRVDRINFVSQSVSKHHTPPGPHTAQRRSDVDDVTSKAPLALPE